MSEHVFFFSSGLLGMKGSLPLHKVGLKKLKNFIFLNTLPLPSHSSNFSNSIQLRTLDLAAETLSLQLIKCMTTPIIFLSVKIIGPLLGGVIYLWWCYIFRYLYVYQAPRIYGV